MEFHEILKKFVKLYIYILNYRLFSEPALVQRAWDIIDAQAELALTSEAFADIGKKIMCL